MNVNPQATAVKVAGHVDYNRVEGEVVLLDLKRGGYYGLDAVASLIWEALVADGRIDSAIDRLRAEYEVSLDRAQRDVQELVERWHGLGLIHAAS